MSFPPVPNSAGNAGNPLRRGSHQLNTSANQQPLMMNQRLSLSSLPPNNRGPGGVSSQPLSHRTTTNKAHSHPTSVDAMFRGLLPGTASASPSNPRQHLSGLHFGSTATTPTASGGTGSGTVAGRYGAADPSHLPPSTPAMLQQQQQQQQQQQHWTALRRNSELTEDIKRLQQLHHLTASTTSTAGDHPLLLQNYLAAAAAKQQQQALQQQQQVQALQQQLAASNASATGGSGSSLAARLMALGGSVGGSNAAVNSSILSAFPPSYTNSSRAGSSTSWLPSPSMLSARSAASNTATHLTFGRPGGPGPGAIEPFPEKLHRMLTEVEQCGKSHIISFVDEGRAFAIHQPTQFFKEVVPLYFRQSRLSSFKRQLNLYGFELISSGPSRGAYFHDLFQKDQPNLCRRMRRVAVKVSSKSISATSTTSSTEPEDKSGSDKVSTTNDSLVNGSEETKEKEEYPKNEKETPP